MANHFSESLNQNKFNCVGDLLPRGRKVGEKSIMALKSVSIKGLVVVPQVNFSRLAIVQPNYYDQCAQYNSAVATTIAC